MLVRGRARVGLMEVLAARHEGEGLTPWGHSRKAARAALALAGVGGVTLTLMLSLGGGGPVLSALPGASSGGQAGSADVLAASALESRAFQARPADSQSAARDMPEGLTLRSGEDAGDAPAPRVTLLPVADQGPAMRGEVTAAKPAPSAGVKDLEDGVGGPLARPAADHAPEPPKVKARLIDASADKPLATGVNVSLARP